MTALDFYEVVKLIDNPTTRHLGIADATGIIVGMAEEDGSVWYAVSVDGRSFSVGEKDVSATGRRLRREDLYSGETLRVDAEGNILGVDLN
jgi:hypothetical protein